MTHNKERKERLRELLLAAYPGLRGHLRIGSTCITAIGIVSTWYRYPNLPVQEEARFFTNEWDWLCENEVAKFPKLIKARATAKRKRRR